MCPLFNITKPLLLTVGRPARRWSLASKNLSYQIIFFPFPCQTQPWLAILFTPLSGSSCWYSLHGRSPACWRSSGLFFRYALQSAFPCDNDQWHECVKYALELTHVDIYVLEWSLWISAFLKSMSDYWLTQSPSHPTAVRIRCSFLQTNQQFLGEIHHLASWLRKGGLDLPDIVP